MLVVQDNNLVILAVQGLFHQLQVYLFNCQQEVEVAEAVLIQHLVALADAVMRVQAELLIQLPMQQMG